MPNKPTSQFTAITTLDSADRVVAYEASESELRTVTGTVILAWLGASLDMSTIASGGALSVAYGGSGRATGTTAYSLVATGTTATGAQQTLANGATTEMLVGGGASALPVWTTATGSGAPVRATSPTLVTPVLGEATGMSLSLSGAITIGTGLAHDGTTPAFIMARNGGQIWAVHGDNSRYTIRDHTAGIDVLYVSETTGYLGLGTVANEQLEISKNFRLPASTATTGIFYSGNNTLMHIFSESGSDGKNTFAGENAGNLTLGTGGGASDLGSFNTGFGADVLSALTTGQNNSGFGRRALNAATTGTRNVAVGYDSLYQLTTAELNNAVGDAALGKVTSGDGNNAFGYVAGYSLTTGQHNIAIGSYAGYGSDGTNGPATDNFGILIGYYANRSVVSGTELTNYIVIGNTVNVDASNTVKIGNADITKNYFNGDLSIGEIVTTATPSFYTYKDWTDASNYERGVFGWSAGDLIIGTQIAGTGASKNVIFKRDGTTFLSFTNNVVTVHKDLSFSPDSTYDIGTNGASRPRDLWLSRNASVIGNLSVGVATASAKLHVSGTNNTTGITIQELATSGARNTYLDFINANAGGGDPTGKIRFYADTTIQAGEITSFTGTTTAEGILTFSTRDTTLQERVRIAAAGNVGINCTPNANAILDVTSTTKAFMPPRMTTAQKNAIASPTAGMVIYDSDLAKLCVYTTAWETITSA